MDLNKLLNLKMSGYKPTFYVCLDEIGGKEVVVFDDLFDATALCMIWGGTIVAWDVMSEDWTWTVVERLQFLTEK